MKSKEDLFHLIQAMSKSEKRYFTLDAQKSGRKGSKYLELFQAINAMEEYEESGLKKKFQNNLPSDKIYLYEAILRSMRDYRSSKSLAARIKEMILDAEYLYERGLYGQCEERLREARALAEELDDQLALLEINKEDRNLVWNLKKNYDSSIRGLIEEKEIHIKALTEEFRYLDILYRLGAELRQSPNLQDPLRRQELQKRFPAGLFDERNEPSSVHARRRFLQSAALYYQLFNDPERAAEYYSRVVDWWDENLKYKGEEFYRYIVDLSNLLNAYASQGQYDNFPQLLEKLEKEPVSNVHAQGVVFQKVAIYKLMYYINTGRSEGVDDLAKSIEQGLTTYQINIGSKMVLIFNVSLLLFIKEAFPKCGEWCRKIIKGMKTTSRQDIQRGAHILHLITAFETREPDEIDSAVRATVRFFHTKTNLNKEAFEFAIIDFVKRMALAPPAEVKAIQIELRQYLEQTKSNPAISVPLGLDELVSWWVNSKIQRKSIAWIIQQAKGEK
jgi:hypothetical protein